MRARSLLVWVAMTVTSAVVFFLARGASAATLQLDASASAETVELGDILTISLRAVVTDGDMPSDPRPGPVPGFSVVGTSSSPMRMQMNFNGQPSSKSILTTIWRLRADKLGTFALGPASVSVHGARNSARAISVTVVARGKAPRARRPDPLSDPFGGQDPFGGLLPFGGQDPFGGHDPFGGSFSPFRGLFGDDEPFEPTVRATADPKLNLDRPRAKVAFLHATVDKARAVLGEQVTMHVYLYSDPYARQAQPNDVHEATANDFVKRSLLADETHTTDLGIAIVGGRPWSVSLVRKNALFPLKTGHLEIGPMSLNMPQLQPGLRQSEPLAVDVTEAPLTGRPAGFVAGNVGAFSLQATVSNRTLDEGGAIGVTVELRGTGNLPAELPLPVSRDVEWLAPTTRDKLGSQQGDKFGGTRTFEYVVRVHKSGAVDLGEIRLPYFDPARRAYGVAQAALGIVNVKPGAVHAARTTEAALRLPNLPKPRLTLEHPERPRAVTDFRWYWFALVGAPLASVLGLGAERALRALRERRAERAPDPARVAKARRAEAATLVSGDDGKAAMGAIVRAVRAAVFAETGVHLGAVVGEAARAELREADVAEALGARITTLLRQAEDAQFSPDGISPELAKETWGLAEKVLADLEGSR